MLAGATSAPASSLAVNVTETFSPGSIVPSPSLVPASARAEIAMRSPPLSVAFASGCVCASRTEMFVPLWVWHSGQAESVPCAGIVMPFEVYGWAKFTSSWQAPQDRREGWTSWRPPPEGAGRGPAPSGSPWHFAHRTGPLRIWSSVALSAVASAV